MSCDDGGGSKETSKKAVVSEVTRSIPVETPIDKPKLRHTAFTRTKIASSPFADNLKTY